MPRVRLRPEDLRFDPPSLEFGVLAAIAKDSFGVVGAMSRLRGERDQNTLVEADGQAYVLKLSSPSEDPGTVDFHCQALLHLEATAPELLVPRLVPAVGGDVLTEAEVGGVQYLVRLLTFIPGTTFDDAGAVSRRGLESVGALQGEMASAFADFTHPSAANFMPWDLDSGLLLNDGLWSNLAPDAREVAEVGRSRIEAVCDTMKGMRRQVIHNDGHRGNIIRPDSSAQQAVGVIDFGDLVHTAMAADLGISGASFAADHPDPLAALGALARGFHRHHPLLADEVAALPDLVLARLTLSTLLVEYQMHHSPHIAAAVALERPELLRSVVVWGDIDPAEAGSRLVEMVGAS